MIWLKLSLLAKKYGGFVWAILSRGFGLARKYPIQSILALFMLGCIMLLGVMKWKLDRCEREWLNIRHEVDDLHAQRNAWRVDSTLVHGRADILQASVDRLIEQSRRDSIDHAATLRVTYRNLERLREELASIDVSKDSTVFQLGF